MRFMQWAKDGGPTSTVDGLFIIEIKSLFSIVLLRFSHGLRDSYHSHAFNAITWFLRGAGVMEHEAGGMWRLFVPSWMPKVTPRDCVHKVESIGTMWAISFRGPWRKTWFELRGAEKRRADLGHGRVELTEDTPEIDFDKATFLGRGLLKDKKTSKMKGQA